MNNKRYLKMMESIEENADATMKMYDLCENKCQYKKFYKFVKSQVKEMRKLNKVKDIKVSQVKSIDINETFSVDCYIKNFNPDMINDRLEERRPIEIFFELRSTSGKGLKVNGSSYYGGCNEAEALEFLEIIKAGISDFSKEVI